MLFALGASATFGQQDRGAIQISGRVSRALRLSLDGSQLADGAQAVIEAQGPDFIQIGLSGDGNSKSARVSIPLKLRTNVGYELKLSLLSSSGCRPRLTPSIESIRPSGGAVMAGAAENSRSLALNDLVNPDNPVPVLAGPRISAKGTFTTASNALLVNLNIAATENSQSACPWRASLRISLHPDASL